LGVVAPGFAASDRVTVGRDVTVHGQTIHLGDVASLEGERAQALASLQLGSAPGAGESRTLDGMVVLQALRREVGDLDSITYTIPPMVRVHRATQELTETAVRGVVEAFLRDALGAGAAEAELRTVELPGPVRIPAGPWTGRVMAAPGAPLLGRVRLQIELSVEDRPVKSIWVVADVGLYGEVVVVRRPIARGETISAGDLAVDRRDLAQVPRGVVTDVAEAAGRVARAALVPYTPIRREQIESPAAVHRGDVVLLVAEQAGLRITTPGEVRDDAGVGEQVRVVNRVTRKDLVGHVLDASTVAVDF
jgi:flagella basal body P-ring formation protein FlgA